MQKIKYSNLIFMVMIFILYSCTKIGSFAAESSDLNGTWQPDWSYKTSPQTTEARDGTPKMKFSWGEGIYIYDITFNIDTTAEEPFFDSSNGRFYIIDVSKIGKNSIKVIAYQPLSLSEPELKWEIEIIFHFLDKNTFWIETEDIRESLVEGREYGEGALWYRLSGPEVSTN